MGQFKGSLLVLARIHGGRLWSIAVAWIWLWSRGTRAGIHRAVIHRRSRARAGTWGCRVALVAVAAGEGRARDTRGKNKKIEPRYLARGRSGRPRATSGWYTRVSSLTSWSPSNAPVDFGPLRAPSLPLAPGRHDPSLAPVLPRPAPVPPRLTTAPDSPWGPLPARAPGRDSARVVATHVARHAVDAIARVVMYPRTLTGRYQSAWSRPRVWRAGGKFGRETGAVIGRSDADCAGIGQETTTGKVFRLYGPLH